MITLKTLEQATKQEIFDQVANHLLTQMQKSENIGRKCMYRNYSGLKCAAGCLISDEEYEERFEGCSWYKLIEREQISKYHERLIQELQDIHDNYEVCDWKDELKYLANKRNLKWKF
jgi:hypothetical protein